MSLRGRPAAARDKTAATTRLNTKRCSAPAALGGRSVPCCRVTSGFTWWRAMCASFAKVPARWRSASSDGNPCAALRAGEKLFATTVSSRRNGAPPARACAKRSASAYEMVPPGLPSVVRQTLAGQAWHTLSTTRLRIDRPVGRPRPRHGWAIARPGASRVRQDHLAELIPRSAAGSAASPVTPIPASQRDFSVLVMAFLVARVSGRPRSPLSAEKPLAGDLGQKTPPEYPFEAGLALPLLVPTRPPPGGVAALQRWPLPLLGGLRCRAASNSVYGLDDRVRIDREFHPPGPRTVGQLFPPASQQIRTQSRRGSDPEFCR